MVSYPESDITRELLHLAEEGGQEGGLAGAHRTHHGGQLSVLDVQVNAGTTRTKY